MTISFLLSSQRCENTNYSCTRLERQSKGRFKKGVAHYHKHETFQKLQKEQQRAAQIKPVFFKRSTVTHFKQTGLSRPDASSLVRLRMNNNHILLTHNDSSSLAFLRMATITIVFFSTFFSVSAQATGQNSVERGLAACQVNRITLLSTSPLSSLLKASPTDETKTICNVIDQANKEINQFVKECANATIDTAALANTTKPVIFKVLMDAYDTLWDRTEKTMIFSLKSWFNYTSTGRFHYFYVKGESKESFGNRIAKATQETSLKWFRIFFNETYHVFHTKPSPDKIKSIKESLGNQMELISENRKIKYLNDWCHYPSNLSKTAIFAILGGSFLGVITLACTIFASIFGYNKWRNKQILSKSSYEEI